MFYLAWSNTICSIVTSTIVLLEILPGLYPGNEPVFGQCETIGKVGVVCEIVAGGSVSGSQTGQRAALV